jgi:tripeptide aminopeptidase
MFSLLDRFCRYVRIDTKANEGAGKYPSSAGQWDLAKLLVEELRSIGVKDVTFSDHGRS